MVEDKHSINTILSFGAKSVNPEVLEKLLIGRVKDAEYLYNSVKSIAIDGNNQHLIVIGQRGMGKTHLFRILYHRTQEFIAQNKIVVAYFSEEEYGVASYFDFLTRIINAFIKWNDNDRELLLSKLEELQETQLKAQVNVAEKIIEDYIGNRPLLILAENFGEILESIKPAEQSKLRNWLYRVNRISIIASSQSISADFEKEDRPFYGFFNTYYLKNLDFEGSLEFLISLAKLDQRDDVVKHLKNKGRSQVEAVHQLVKGNHRLLVTFYEFLKTDTLAKLSSHFIKTINDLKPYYETYIRYLPAQQQKILRYIALSRKPQQGIDISKNCFINQKSLSKELSELNKKRLIDVLEDFDDKRNKLYDIMEPLLRISIEVGEHREGITALFIDFLAIYYNEEELEKRKNKFSNTLAFCESLNEKSELNYEIQAIDKALQLKKTIYCEESNNTKKPEILIEINKNIKDSNYDYAINLLEKNKSLLKKSQYYYALGYCYLMQKQYNKAIEIYKKAENEKEIYKNLYNNWGYVLSEIAIQKLDINLFKESILKFQKSIETNVSNDDNGLNNYNMGLNYTKLYQLTKSKDYFFESIKNYRISSKINPKSELTFFNWGNVLKDYALDNFENIEIGLKYIKEASQKYSIAYKINPENINIINNYGKSLTEIGRYYNDEKLLTKSINLFKKGLKISENCISINQNYCYAVTDLANLKKDKNLFEEGFVQFEKTILLDIKNYNIYLSFERELSNYNLLFGESSSYLNILEKFIKESKDKTLKYYFISNQFKNSNYDLFKTFINLLDEVKIENDKFLEILIFWSLNILSEKRNNLTSEKIAFMKKIIKKNLHLSQELVVLENYLTIYEEYVIKGNKKAIYNLPKEERNFFKEKILMT